MMSTNFALPTDRLYETVGGLQLSIRQRTVTVVEADRSA